ncbi:acyl carrier protein [Streptomyces sp. SID6648]|nr:acyl carrier protein [Streptomyces sp. SID6648]
MDHRTGPRLTADLCHPHRDALDGHAPHQPDPGRGHRVITEKVHDIWARELDLESFGDDDDFFLLGGHSLLMVRLQAELLDAFGIEVPMDELFERSTVHLLSAYLMEQVDDPAGPAGEVPCETRPPSRA